MRILFDSAMGDGPRGGIVIFGEGPPPPPASDPDVGYPPDVDWDLFGGFQFVREGFEYAIVNARVDGSRIRVSVRLGDLWAGWCSLQTPVPLSATGEAFGCLPNTGGSIRDGSCFYNDLTTGEPVSVDCGKYRLCGGIGTVCVCNSVQCTAEDVGEVSFDFHVVGDNGDGSVTIDGLHNVHLTR